MKYFIYLLILIGCKGNKYYPIINNDNSINNKEEDVKIEKIKWLTYENFSDNFITNDTTTLNLLSLKLEIDSILPTDSMNKYVGNYFFRNNESKQSIIVAFEWYYSKPFKNIKNQSRLVICSVIDTINWKIVSYTPMCFQCGTGQSRMISVYDKPASNYLFIENLHKNRYVLDDWVLEMALKKGLL